MRFPYLEPIPQARDVLTKFKGLNRTQSVADGEFTHMLNMTGDDYPVLSPRKKRWKCHTFTKCNGIYAKAHLLWADGTDLYYDGELKAEDALLDSEKMFVGMGAYVLIFPDKKVFNTETGALSPLGITFTTVGNTTFSLCGAEGNLYSYEAGTEPPDAPQTGDYWLDESGETKSLKRYSSYTGEWTAVSTLYVRLDATGIGNGFSAGDGVTISGCQDSQFNGDFLLKGAGTDHIVLNGIIPQNAMQAGPVTVSRKIPDMDYLTESGNRVWGCARDGHEIYACKLGDPFNWRVYEGISTDSYAATVGTDGPFTGAASLLGSPVFFKENVIHKVVGGYPFQIQAIDGRGVQLGSECSIAAIGGVLFYKAPEGIAAYNGDLPAIVSRNLGEEAYRYAAGGHAGGKYYVSMTDSSGQTHLFVLDTATGLWHREDGAGIRWFVNCQSDLFFVEGNILWAVTHGDAVALFDQEEEGYAPGPPETCAPLAWCAETGDLLWMDMDKKHVKRLNVKLGLGEGSAFKAEAQYDGSGAWETVADIPGPAGRRQHNIRIIPRWCGHFRLRLSGTGDVKVFALSKTVEGGSEL